MAVIINNCVQSIYTRFIPERNSCIYRVMFLKNATKFCKYKDSDYICSPNREGEVVEWSITAVLKTVELKGSGGSNPSLSANNI